MYIMSRDAGWGRNFWKYVDDGTVNVHAREGYLCATIRSGVLVRLTTRTKDECTTLTYGEGLTTKKANKTIKQVYYESGTLQAIRRGGLWKNETGVRLCGSAGAVECYATSSGAYGREIFKYSNGNLGYIASRWRKKLEVKRPTGKIWIVIEGQVHLDYSPIAGKLNPDAGDIPLWGLMRGSDWRMTVYDLDGKTVITQGQVENRQKQGRWLEDGKESYYISGVKVSRQLYEDDPDKWNASEVLKIPNAQLRCSLLNRMGYDKLLEKVKCKIIEESVDEGQLLEIDTSVAEGSTRGLDKIMRVIKVVCPSTRQVYVLRVPPDIASFEQARQWTFGLREASIREGVQLELVRET